MESQNEKAICVLSDIVADILLNKNNEKNLVILETEINKIEKQIDECGDDKKSIAVQNMCYFVNSILLKFVTMIQDNRINDLLSFDLEVKDILNK